MPSLPSFSQYFMDVAEADSWLQEQRSTLKSASFGQDQVATETLLRQHLRLERSVHTFGTELHRLDEQARVATAQAALLVHRDRIGTQTHRPLTPNAHYTLDHTEGGNEMAFVAPACLPLGLEVPTPSHHHLPCCPSPELVEYCLPLVKDIRG